MMPIGVISHRRKLLTYRYGAVEPANTAVVTWENVPIGDPAPGREVVVVVLHKSSGSDWFNSVTIGGQSAVADVGAGWNQNTQLVGAGIYRASIPTGTTATIEVAGRDGRMLNHIAVWTSNIPLSVVTAMTGALGVAPAE